MRTYATVRLRRSTSSFAGRHPLKDKRAGLVSVMNMFLE
jgi:hypothetical protein